ncbi:MAG: chromosome segregation protein SMC [Candidatus Gastranaerophilales bacterium]|nr:chromosome segregation protein SMC [Candidatus Gastranaerophilales bacterium]
MYIKELEVDNFKSFASDVTIPFLKGFTTISGPNGSGKSNIIDSVLFALGLSTSRTLRAEKLFHLISTHTNRNEAYVRVSFGAEKDDEEELKIARRIRKSNQGFNSIYYLNDKITTLSDIHSKLEKYNITPNSYNVMMQGDVTSITNCSANDRRKIIDEIAGVADFDRRIEQASNELETVEQRVEKSTIILNEITTRIEQLAQEREVALKYQKLKQEKNALESQITTVKYFDIKRSIEKVHESILDCNKKKKEEEFSLKELQKKLASVQTKYDEIAELVKTNGEAEQIETKKQVEELKGQIERKTTASNYADKNIHDNLRTIENAKNGIENLKNKINATNSKIEAKKAEIKDIENNIKSQENELNRILQEASGLTQTAEQHIEKRNSLRKTLEKLKDDELNIQKESIPLETELSNAKREIEDSKNLINEFNDFSANFAGNKDKLELQVKELSQELEDYKIVQQNVMYELDKTKNETNDLGYNIQMAYRKISQLEAQKNAYEEINLGRAIETVLNAKLDGVHAPLLQLGKVDKEYSTALEIAMGGRMKNIVVDDEHVAKVAIDILKSARAGSATFLPLNKIRKAPSSLRLPKDKGVVDFAINLIDFDDEYLDAFYHALGETLVVEDYECARKLIGHYRMVTLDGSLFEKSGSITGGSRAQTGLKFSQNQNDELDTFKKRLKDFEKNYAELEAKKKELEVKQEKVRVDYSNSLNTLNGAKMELSNLIKNSEENDKKIVEREALIKNLQPKTIELEKKLDSFESKLIEINEKTLQTEEEIKEIESKMSEGELAKLKEMTESVENSIKKYQSKVLSCQNDINDLNREIDFSNDVIKTKEEQIESLLKDNKKLEEDKVQYIQDIKVLESKIKELNSKIQELGEKLVKLQTERDAVQTELLELEKQKNVYTSDLEKMAEQIEAFKSRRRELDPALNEIEKELKEAGIETSSLTPVDISTEEITSKIQRLQRRMEEMEPVNMRAITAYDEVIGRQEELKNKIETLAKERTEILERMTGYEDLKKKTFLETYDDISVNFKDIFSQLSDGHGSLVLENPDNPFLGGLTIEAATRDKKAQRLESMSGGEKSLTALAFVFSIQRHLPAPFYAFDEVDMHLDGINVEKLAEMIKKQSNDAQFIVVSLRKPMIESANRTIGVTQKEKGKTKVTGVKLRD